MPEQEMKEYVESLEQELYAYRRLGTPCRIKAALRRDSKARRRHNAIVRWIGRVPVIIGTVFLAWVFLSWLEVVTHNTIPGYEYHIYNFFNLLCH